MGSRRGPLLNRHALKALRTVADLSLDDLADRVEIHPASLSRLESGMRRHPPYAVTTRMADVLGVPVEALLGVDAEAMR